MPVDWRSLLSELGVQWVDRGRNVSRGHVNIPCPLCGDDPSYHCSISEERDYFRCWREPTHHGSGVALVSRLIGGRRARWEALALIDSHSLPEAPQPLPRAPVGVPARKFDTFQPAYESPAMLDYLEARGFLNPETTCRRFNLRYAPYGKWAARLLLPLYLPDGRIGSFTGRGIRTEISPKYLTAPCDENRSLIFGEWSSPNILIVEGPFDALKINDAMWGQFWKLSAIALLGKQLTAERLAMLRRLRGRKFFVCLDAGTPIPTRTIVQKVRANRDYCQAVRLPPDIKDPGELTQEHARAWAEELINEIQVGRST